MARKAKKVIETQGARFRRARERAGMTQAEVAARLGKPYRYISDIETDRRTPTIQWVFWASAVLGWWPGDLDPSLADLAVIPRPKADPK